MDSSESPKAVSVDPVTNDVYVYQGFSTSVAVFESSGAPLSLSGFSAGEGFSLGLGVDESSGALYLPEFRSKVVSVFQMVVLPEVTTGMASNKMEATATLNGKVNAEGRPVTSCKV